MGCVWSGSHSLMLARVSLLADTWEADRLGDAGYEVDGTSAIPMAVRVASMLRWMYGRSSVFWAGLTLRAWTAAG